MTRLLILVLAISLVGSMHYGLWRFLVKDPELPPRARRAGTIGFIALALIAPASFLSLLLMRTPAAQVVAVGVFTWLGLALMLISLLLVLRIPLGIANRLARVDPSRRLFLARTVAGSATLATAGAGIFAVGSATGPAELSEVPVKLARLPKALSGFTIAQISDLHVGPTIREREVRRVVEQVNALKPDLVAITGDLVDGSVAQLGFATQHLAGLTSRFGTYFVTGNHEYYSGADEWSAELRRLGITVLRNERVSIGDAASFDLAGVDDFSGPTGGGENPESDLKRALQGRDAERSLVLFAHQPRKSAFIEAVGSGVELGRGGPQCGCRGHTATGGPGSAAPVQPALVGSMFTA
ncbi:MAG: metallophosphoesterase [Archangiaceae bacterium]|nr:metallophosphoesterase [Archangiaceae bacterium]